jgi:small subunit ribosomal protein S4
VGDKIELREKSRAIKEVGLAMGLAERRAIPGWLEIDRPNFSAVVKSAPIREELNEPAIREQYIVEYYSR